MAPVPNMFVFLLVIITIINIVHGYGRCVGAPRCSNPRLQTHAACTDAATYQYTADCVWNPSYCERNPSSYMYEVPSTFPACYTLSQTQCADAIRSNCRWKIIAPLSLITPIVLDSTIALPSLHVAPRRHPLQLPDSQPFALAETATPYAELIGVNRNFIIRTQQPVASARDKSTVTHTQFVQHISGEWPVSYANGIYDFIVLDGTAAVRDTMHLLHKTDARIATSVGHSSLLDVSQYAQLKAGTLKMVFAGEIHITNGDLDWWTLRSGHFMPDERLRKVFATHWHLPEDKYKTVQQSLSVAHVGEENMYRMDMSEDELWSQYFNSVSNDNGYEGGYGEAGSDLDRLIMSPPEEMEYAIYLIAFCLWFLMMCIGCGVHIGSIWCIFGMHQKKIMEFVSDTDDADIV